MTKQISIFFTTCFFLFLFLMNLRVYADTISQENINAPKEIPSTATEIQNTQPAIPKTQIEIPKTPQEITKIEVVGNKTVSTEAVLNIIALKVGETPTTASVRQDIKSLVNSGYFSDVSIVQKPDGTLVIHLRERPTLRAIEYEGFSVVTPSSFSEKILTKPYSILDEKKVAEDLKTIEQAYVEKGYYLAKANYYLTKVGDGVSDIVFTVQENAPVRVRKVTLAGNEYFSDSELKGFMMTREYTWLSFLNSSGVFRDEFLDADQNNLAYLYRDQGFAEATVANPNAILDKSKTHVDVSYYIEQGERFKIGTIKIAGDLIASEQELKKVLTMQTGDYYRISKFTEDMKALKNFYGDRGYAFVYVYPSFDIDRKLKIYNITYNITQGKKAYFRNIVITGNTKTRDNVIRRALKVSEGQLFNATNLERSKREVEYLGLFGKVDFMESSDPKNGFVDVKVVIQEKSTGQFRASLGASPSSFGGGNIKVYGDLAYREQNLLGRGYSLSLNVNLSPSQDSLGTLNYTFGLDFVNPSVYDSLWSFGVSASYNYQLTNITKTTAESPTSVFIKSKSVLASVTIGREIIDHLRFTLGYSFANYVVNPSIPLTQNFYQSGNTEEFTQSLIFDLTDDAKLPTSGLYISALNALGLRWTSGQFNYGTFSGNISYYQPLYITKDFKTHFRFVIIPRYVYETSKLQKVPYWKRLSLGNDYFMKGYRKAGETLSPTVPVTISPVTGQVINMYTGGNRSYYGAAEYFVPLIPEIGLRFVMFAEAGTVLDEQQFMNLASLKYDVGFGLRWMTSVAPFRFEWAFPVEHGRLGPSQFVFTVGLDSSALY